MRTHKRGLPVAAAIFALLIGVGGAVSQPRFTVAPDSLSASRHGADLILAQAAGSQLLSLQEEIRRLNGRIEELNFQILQMQDQMRRMQEDNEFRFQELEQQRSDAGDSGGGAGTGTERAERPAQPAQETNTAKSDPQTGEPPRVLGTIEFDENGNIVSADPGTGLPAAQQSDPSVVAALPPSNSPDEVYRNAYEFVLSGDYDTAETGFKQYLAQFPDGERAAEANFWLGEALLGQDRPREAAEVFLEANKEFPDSPRAPEMLFKLGVSLNSLGQNDVACATFTEIGQRYPNASDLLMERVRQEQQAAQC